MTAKQYLLDLPYIDWHKVSDIPEDITDEVIELIDEGFHCKYKFNDDWTEFRKYTKRSHKAKGNTLPKDSVGKTIKSIS